MAVQNIKSELAAIKDSIQVLTDSVSKVVSITGNDGDGHGQIPKGKNETNDSHNDYFTYTNLYIEKHILTLENKTNEKLTILEDKIESNFEAKIEKLKPNYVMIIAGTVIPTVIAIIALFFAIIPTYIENEWLNKSDTIIKSKVDDVVKDFATVINDMKIKINNLQNSLYKP